MSCAPRPERRTLPRLHQRAGHGPTPFLIPRAAVLQVPAQTTGPRRGVHHAALHPAQPGAVLDVHHHSSCDQRSGVRPREVGHGGWCASGAVPGHVPEPHLPGRRVLLCVVRLLPHLLAAHHQAAALLQAAAGELAPPDDARHALRDERSCAWAGLVPARAHPAQGGSCVHVPPLPILPYLHLRAGVDGARADDVLAADGVGRACGGAQAHARLPLRVHRDTPLWLLPLHPLRHHHHAPMPDVRDPRHAASRRAHLRVPLVHPAPVPSFLPHRPWTHCSPAPQLLHGGGQE
mmetsp:Transcript_8092/g.15364  ORF Transcript_8092/g.15364 Transcript_8092/m.15364 type:complete len:291 (+) Transcript_8092:137-1009(+)